jgi:prepilin-type N-terminal cleavage/methylation domain-containing protein
VISKFKPNQGVTLLEVVITTIVIGILASLSAPNVMGMLARNNSKSAVQIIHSAIQEVKKEGIRNSKPCKLWLSFNKMNGELPELRADKTGCAINVDEQVKKAMVIDLPDNVSFATSNLPRTTNAKLSSSMINFNSKGVLTYDGVGMNTPDLSRPAVIVVAAEGTNSADCLVITPVLGLVRSGKYTGNLGENPYKTLKDYYPYPEGSKKLDIEDAENSCQVDM